MTAHLVTAMPRSKVHYATTNASHHMVLHWAPGTDAALAATNATAVLNQLKVFVRTGVSFDVHEFAPAGSNIFNPTTWTPIAGTNPSAVLAYAYATCISFSGRTVGGCRARLFVFTDCWAADSNYRQTESENSGLTAVFNWLNSTSSPLTALDGLGPVWKRYINVSENRYWVKHLRG